MKHSLRLWIIAFLITAASAAYQRLTGPTHPMSGDVTIDGTFIHYSLPRSHGGPDDCPVELTTNDDQVRGIIEWKPHNSNDEWTSTEMKYANRELSAQLPHQPPAGKLDYRITLTKAGEQRQLPASDPLVIRFKGDVPLPILILHILAMFGGMLLSARAGLEALQHNAQLSKLILWTIVLLFFGGLILGPVVQWYAFGVFWTGWPVGTDLTDNKTAVALISWIIAAIMLRRSAHPSRWALAASLITLAVYLIPHSVLGSELDCKSVR